MMVAIDAGSAKRTTLPTLTAAALILSAAASILVAARFVRPLRDLTQASLRNKVAGSNLDKS